MKRIGNLINNITEYNNLYLAFWKATKGKNDKKDVIEYRENLEKNILHLQTQILHGELEIGNYHYFKIYDPKERTICAASFPERVLHHAIMNVCHQYFEKKLFFHTYATRPKKGTHKAIAYAQKLSKKYKYYAKLDVRKYFDSINHKILKQKLSELFKDPHLLYVFNQIIDSYSTKEQKGLPIGNLTSQYFANYFLSSADHFAKEVLKLPYLRYMDDMILFCDDKMLFKQKLDIFENYLNKTLDLKLKYKHLNKTKRGFSFLGFVIFPYKIRLNKLSKKRFKYKLKIYYQNLEQNFWSQKEFSNHILPLFDFVKQANSYLLRKNSIFAHER